MAVNKPVTNTAVYPATTDSSQWNVGDAAGAVVSGAIESAVNPFAKIGKVTKLVSAAQKVYSKFSKAGRVGKRIPGNVFGRTRASQAGQIRIGGARPNVTRSLNTRSPCVELLWAKSGDLSRQIGPSRSPRMDAVCDTRSQANTARSRSGSNAVAEPIQVQTSGLATFGSTGGTAITADTAVAFRTMTRQQSIDEVVLDLLSEDRFALWEIAGVVARACELEQSSAIVEARNALQRLGTDVQVAVAVARRPVGSEEFRVLDGAEVAAILEDWSNWDVVQGAPVAFATAREPESS